MWGDGGQIIKGFMGKVTLDLEFKAKWVFNQAEHLREGFGGLTDLGNC